MASYQNGQGNVNPLAAHVNTPPVAPDQPIDPVVEILGAGRIVAHRVDLALAVGSTTAGLLLSQFWFWSNAPTAKARDGWFYMTADEISEQTGLSREEQMTARKRLVKLGIVEEDKRGTPMKIWFHVKKAELLDLLREYAELKIKLWALPKDEPSALPKDEDQASPTVGIAQSNLWAMPKDRFGQLRKIASGKAKGLVSGIPKDITNSSSSNSSPMSLDVSDAPEGASAPIDQGREEDNPAAMLWDATLSELKAEVNKPTFETHLRGLTAESFDGATLTLSAQNAFTRNWVEIRHKTLIEQVATRLVCESVSVNFATRNTGGIDSGKGASHAG